MPEQRPKPIIVQPTANTLPFTGGVRVQLQLSPLAQGRVVLAAQVSCVRPDAGRALAGLPIETAWQRLPHLLSLCPIAQQTAAAQAFAALALAQPSHVLLPAQIQSPPIEQLAAEWMREHAWQNWQLLALDVDAMPFLADTRVLRQPNRQGWETAFTHLCGLSAEAFCSLASFEDWMAWLQHSTAPYPALLHRYLPLLSFGAQSSCSQPESGAFGRQYAHPMIQALIGRYGNGIAARLTARWLEMARLIAEPAEQVVLSGVDQTATCEKGESSDMSLSTWRVSGHAMASRGSLSHRITVQNAASDDDPKLARWQIARWEIDAPTDRYFARGGLLEQALNGQTADDQQQALRATELLLRAIDPCVGFEIVCAPIEVQNDATA